MKITSKFWLTLSVVSLLGITGCNGILCQQTTPENNPNLSVHIQESVKPALVRIYVVASEMRNGREHKMEGAGSGAIITPEGHVVTNHHVVGHAKKIWCTLSNLERVEAELIGTDPLTDIAIIKLLPETMRKPVKSFPYLAWGNSDKVKAGDRVFALGSPGALAQSITEGIVSNPEIVMPNESLVLDGESVSTMVRWIFHDAQIYHGNSGGPLVNVHGEIIGINEMGTASLGGAIPSNTARHTVDAILKYNGKVPRSWTGINLQRLLFSDTSDVGALISWIDENSPAQKAGLKSGDKLIKINNKAIRLRYEEEFPAINRMLTNTLPGTELNLTILRNGKKLQVKLVTEERGLLANLAKEIYSLGITASNLTRFTARALQSETLDGVLITGIREGFPIDQAKPKLTNGDIIKKINNTPIKSVDELEKVIDTLLEENQDPDKKIEVLVTAQHQLDEILTVIPLEAIKEAKVTPLARKAWFPGNVQILTIPLAKKLDIPNVRGVRITRIFPQLKDSGFKVGDIITKVNDTAVDAYDPSHINVFSNIITNCSTFSPTTFSVIRDGKPMEISFKLPRSPKPAAELPSYKNDFYGLKVRCTTDFDKIDNKIELEQNNIIISGIEDGGWASLGKLQSGDIILTINGTPIKTLKECQAVLEKTIQEKATSIIFFVKRGQSQGYIEVRPDWKK